MNCKGAISITADLSNIIQILFNCLTALSVTSQMGNTQLVFFVVVVFCTYPKNLLLSFKSYQFTVARTTVKATNLRMI